MPVDRAIGLPLELSVNMCGLSLLCIGLDSGIACSPDAEVEFEAEAADCGGTLPPAKVTFSGHADLDQSILGFPFVLLQLPPYQCQVTPLSGEAACAPAR